MIEKNRSGGDGRDHVWETGWADHEQRQMNCLADLSLPEKLAWLEEAHRLVLQLRADSTPGSDL